MSGRPGAWEWFGHGGSFRGYITRTVVFPGQGLAVSVMTNAVDGPAHPWVDGIAHILETVAAGGVSAAKTRGWRKNNYPARGEA